MSEIAEFAYQTIKYNMLKATLRVRNMLMGNFLLIFIILKIVDYPSDEEDVDNDVEVFDQVGLILGQSIIIVVNYT